MKEELIIKVNLDSDCILYYGELAETLRAFADKFECIPLPSVGETFTGKDANGNTVIEAECVLTDVS